MEDERASLQMVLVDTHQHALALASAEASQQTGSRRAKGNPLLGQPGKTYHEIALIRGSKPVR